MSKPVKTISNQHKWSENEKFEKTIIASTQSSYPSCYQIIKQQIEHNSVIHIRIWIHRRERERVNGFLPVTMAVRPVASIPWVTSSAVEDEENPDGPFLLKSHILSLQDSLFLSLTDGNWEKLPKKRGCCSLCHNGQVLRLSTTVCARSQVAPAEPGFCTCGCGGCNIYQRQLLLLYWLNGWCSSAEHARGQFTGCMYWCYVFFFFWGKILMLCC